MMEDLNDKVTGNKLTAAEFVQPMSELQNVIEGTGQTLTSGNLNQLGNGIAEYVANGAFYIDSGSVNTHVLSQIGSKQAPKAYVDGMSVEFISITSNTGAATVDVANLGAKTIIDTSLAGEIVAGVRYSLRYRLGSDDFEIVTAKSTASQQGIQSITATVASNALTAGLNKTALYFRSSSLTDGLSTLINITTALSLVVPSTATLGTVSGVASRLILLAINNAGTAELAIINQSGGNDLSETGLISTIVLDALSTNNNVAYSTTARNNVAYRVVGFIDSTQTTAGTWATAPSTIQGAGGNFLNGRFISAEQTITSAGSLSIAHGLGVEPTLITVTLVCKVAEAGFNAGDKISLGTGGGSSGSGTNAGHAITNTATNVNIRFGSSIAVYAITNNSTGDGFNITNASWKLIVRAWA